MAEKYYSVVDCNLTDYCACCLQIKWIISAIAGRNNPSGFVVQHFSRQIHPNLGLKELEDTDYFEAWKIDKGVCIDTAGNAFDDEFAVGNPLDTLEVFPYSISKKGEIEFSGTVYWVEQDTALYNIVDRWPRGQVVQAGGLKSVKGTFAFEKVTPVFIRDKFIHCWDLSTEESIYLAASKALFAMCRDPNNERDRKIFCEQLNEMLPAGHEEIKQRLRKEFLGI